MNHLNSSQTSTLTQSIVTTNHGKKISAIAMDVHHDGQRIADRIQDKDIMDTTIDNAHEPHEPTSHSVDSEAPAKPQVAVEAEPPSVSDNPIEKDEGAQQLSKQMRKTPH